MNKKIVIFINSLDGGGAERVVSTLLNDLVEKYECYLILMENKISYDIDSRINIISLDESSNQNGIVKLLRLPVIAYKLSRVIKKYNFSQISSFLYRANYVNVLAKYFSQHKCIISERIAPSSMYEDNSLSSKISKFLIKNLYNKADKIIPVSKAIKNDLIENFDVNIKQKVIYNPYDIEKIEQLSKEDISYEIDRKKSIITVGSLGQRKNHSLLINAFSKIDDKEYKLYILGKGEEEANLKNLVYRLGLNERVVFLGFDNNPYKYLSKCGIFVLASNSEGFPNVLAEAMVCGCSVISTDCLSGPREILAPDSDISFQLENNIELAEYGILSPIKNIEKMKEAMNLIINDESLRKKYQDKAKQRANDFRIDKIIKQYEEIICVE
ncbi:MAG: glycosyltransferase [Arcobacteraceae bacterium]|jgi:N-acetylgalactosamine-N,N'-diacetylbacillosaminyl-diphospho-undecaprenol 4-alpha-N-acetylgalactosaminyltransferase|nr:glycosyltransferase [Bacteroidales bacterium]MDY0364512.1 glycosyltransferase [Arcobacteraceae bacterium]